MRLIQRLSRRGVCKCRGKTLQRGRLTGSRASCPCKPPLLIPFLRLPLLPRALCFPFITTPGVPVFLAHLLWPSREQALLGHTALHSMPAAAVHEISFSWPYAKRMSRVVWPPEGQWELRSHDPKCGLPSSTGPITPAGPITPTLEEERGPPTMLRDPVMS